LKLGKRLSPEPYRSGAVGFQNSSIPEKENAYHPVVTWCPALYRSAFDASRHDLTSQREILPDDVGVAHQVNG
jgi:hypothetical protein